MNTTTATKIEDPDLDTLPQSRSEALEQGTKYYATGKPCKHGHVAKRRAFKGDCMACRKKRNQKYRKNNPQAMVHKAIRSVDNVLREVN